MDEYLIEQVLNGEKLGGSPWWLGEMSDRDMKLGISIVNDLKEGGNAEDPEEEPEEKEEPEEEEKPEKEPEEEEKPGEEPEEESEEEVSIFREAPAEPEEDSIFGEKEEEDVVEIFEKPQAEMEDFDQTRSEDAPELSVSFDEVVNVIPEMTSLKNTRDLLKKHSENNGSSNEQAEERG